MLEGRHVGWNASGHQLGTVMPGFGLPLADLIARVGFEDARELWALSKQGADYVRATATEDADPRHRACPKARSKSPMSMSAIG